MATLIGAGVDVTVNNRSFYSPGIASTIPLIFVATRANKTQLDGVSMAVGTQEYGVVRAVTSVQESLDLYGIPYFHKDSFGNEFHGDSRNEYGLFALNKFLSAGGLAYVVRANINLNDDPKSFMALGTPVVDATQTVYNGIGNGTLTNITAANTNIKPQVVSIVFTSSTNFTVFGSDFGFIGSGIVGTAFNQNGFGFNIAAGSVAYTAGDSYSFVLVYQATKNAPGDTTDPTIVTGLVVDTLAVPEVFTITFTSETAFDVVGTVSTTPSSGVVGTLFDNNRINFTVQHLGFGTKYIVGTVFKVTVTQVDIANPLGVNDAARRVAIVTALQSAVNINTEIRSPAYEFNLLACPGYPELCDELVSLSVDVKNEALVIGDVPVKKSPEQAAQWSLTSERVRGDFVAYYQGWGLASNLDGRNVVVPPSAMALATIAYNDRVAYVWSAPAGIQRGLVSGVSKIGYVTGTLGSATTFVEANLTPGQIDLLYDFDKNLNPIVFMPGRGIVVWGQKTSSAAASALDRINVARLIIYMKKAYRKGAIGLVFQPNDEITRNELKGIGDGICGDILAKGGLYDFINVCDTTNNTPTRIDKNELWIDVYIKPTKTAEYIYVNINVLSTGATL